jgi:hypothetical protein
MLDLIEEPLQKAGFRFVRLGITCFQTNLRWENEATGACSSNGASKD